MRDEKIIALRPQLSLDNSEAAPQEQFQNETLRPILKLQHDVLIAVFKAYIAKRKNEYHSLSESKKQGYIEQAIKSDIAFKNRLIGLIIGHFTLSEYFFFQQEEAELSRRLTHLLIQRLQSAAFTELSQSPPTPSIPI